MRPRYICLALVTIFLFPAAFAQWVQTNGTREADSRHFAVSGRNLFAGTDSRGVFLSTNNGTSWIAAKSGLTDSGVRGLADPGANPFAGTAEQGVFFSTDDGTTWTAANTGLENSPVRTIAEGGANIFAGTGDSVVLSPARPTGWSQFNPGLPGASDYDLIVSSAPGGSGVNHLAGFVPGPVWRMPPSGMVSRVGVSSPGLSLQAGPGQDSPMSFNRNSVLRYGLPYRSHMFLTVFNSLGRRVALLANGGVSPGTVVKR
jgi:hypothetical protein